MVRLIITIPKNFQILLPPRGSFISVKKEKFRDISVEVLRIVLNVEKCDLKLASGCMRVCVCVCVCSCVSDFQCFKPR